MNNDNARRYAAPAIESTTNLTGALGRGGYKSSSGGHGGGRGRGR